MGCLSSKNQENNSEQSSAGTPSVHENPSKTDANPVVVEPSAPSTSKKETMEDESKKNSRPSTSKNGSKKPSPKPSENVKPKKTPAEKPVAAPAPASAPAVVPAAPPAKTPERKRRKSIPARLNQNINLWGIMKSSIGKDLSKIPMPVNFNEPLSMLQRLTEDYEYSDLLDKAITCQDNLEQMTYVAAFALSSYASTAVRTSKPFNPLLGETFECDRTGDLGWRCIAEQVSHHPPIAAVYCEGNEGWIAWQEFSMTSKFRGKYIQVQPLGISHLEFKNSPNHYTWRKVTTTVHNIIIGKLWVEHHGEMDVINHRAKIKCNIKIPAHSYFSREPPRQVTGIVTDLKGNARWILTGYWDDKLESSRVTQVSTGNKKDTVSLLQTGPKKVVWRKKNIPPQNDKMYFFTELAIQLNEPEPGVAPTDSRNRPDQRLMEQGDWAGANNEKVRLEEKQRATRKQREHATAKARTLGRVYPPYEPVWFKKQKDNVTGNMVHQYQGQYWLSKKNRDWSMCPNIY